MDELEKYYNYLKQNGADVPDTYASFKATLSDGSSGETYYNYLKKNGFDTPPTYESFATTFGLKKKILLNLQPLLHLLQTTLQMVRRMLEVRK